MNSKDRDEVKIRKREETLARRLGEALDQMKSHVAQECPDAEIIAAFAEQALGPAESERWEGHFATCTRCRKILRVLAASADTPLAEKEVAQLGELVSTARAPVELKGKSAVRARPRLVDWRTRWLAPALAVAAVLVVWFAMRPPWRALDRGASGTLVAQAPKEEAPLSPAPAEVDRFSKVVPQQYQKKDAAPTRDRSVANAQPLNSPAETQAKGPAEVGNALDRVSPNLGDEAVSLQENNKKLNSLPDGREIQPQAIPAPPRPLRKAQAAMEAPAPQSEAKAEPDAAPEKALQSQLTAGATGNASSRDKEAATVQGGVGTMPGDTVAQTVLPAQQANGRTDEAFAAFRSTRNFSSLLKAPSGSSLWRAGKGGAIERSIDAGKTWASQTSPSQEDWLAGAAVSDAVCWLVGRNGAIARTTDGEHWEIVASPPQAAGVAGKLPEWAGITARDAQSVTITASDGRHFATQDGGRTWQIQ